MKTNAVQLFPVKNKRELNRLRLAQLPGIASLLLCFTLGGRAEIIAPYTPDQHTLHLWHMNEPAAPIADAIPNGVELRSLANGATLGNESFVGAKKFGAALGTYVGNPAIAPGCAGQDAYLAAQPLQNGREDNVAIHYAGADQAFTHEAIVRIDFDPTANFGPDGWGHGRGLFMQLLSGDADESADRVFQFRVAPIGTLNGNTQPLLEFINLNKGSNVQSLTAAIPTEGDEAMRAGNWYHVAVSYDGQPDGKDNLRFYWSLVQSRRTAANLIGTGQMTRSLPTGCNPDFAIGQTGRQSPVTPTPNNNFVGLIDEVRISGVARSPHEMLFGDSGLVRKQTTETADLASAKTSDQEPADRSASPPATTVSSLGVPASTTTEAAVDSVRRAAESVIVVNGAVVRGPLSKPRLAIMFSCRESDEAAQTTLQTLKAHRAKVSFFVSSTFLGQSANRQLVQTMLADGHYVGPQSDTWVRFTKDDRTQNLSASPPAEVESHLGQLTALGMNREDIRYFLPTSDQLTPVLAEQARALGLTMVAGTSGTLSFATATVEGTKEFVSSQSIADSILKAEQQDKGLNGFLLLFPLDSGTRRTDQFSSRFGELIRSLRQRGYEFVRVDELLDNSNPKTRPSLANLKQP